jgi:hypothetical protein
MIEPVAPAEFLANPRRNREKKSPAGTNNDRVAQLSGEDVRIRLRVGPGPVFVYEWLTMARRWQVYAVRTAFVGIILIGMVIVWNNERMLGDSTQTVSIQKLATFGESLYKMIASTELTLVLRVASTYSSPRRCRRARSWSGSGGATSVGSRPCCSGRL